MSLRPLLLLLAFLIAFLISEFIVSEIIQFPTYGAEQLVCYTPGKDPWGDPLWTPIWKANSFHYTAEGRKRIQCNNFGLPGINIVFSEEPIVVLGSSFVMGFECHAESIATSLLQRYIDSTGQKDTVMNLGGIHHDPYMAWCRLRYFENKYGFHPKRVILVTEQGFYRWMEPYPRPLNLEYTNYQEMPITALTRTADYLRNTYGYCNLVETGWGPRQWFKKLLLIPKRIVRKAHRVIKDKPTPIPAEADTISPDLLDVFSAFSETYPSFMLVSISSNDKLNKQLENYCSSQCIDFIYEPLMTPENRIFGKGHLNNLGHQKLYHLLVKCCSGWEE